MDLLCPMPDSDVSPKGGITLVNVETYILQSSSSNNVHAQICYSSWQGLGGGCTVYYYTPTYSVGPRTLGFSASTVSSFLATHSVDFAYIHAQAYGEAAVTGLWYQG